MPRRAKTLSPWGQFAPHKPLVAAAPSTAHAAGLQEAARMGLSQESTVPFGFKKKKTNKPETFPQLLFKQGGCTSCCLKLFSEAVISLLTSTLTVKASGSSVPLLEIELHQ